MRAGGTLTFPTMLSLAGGTGGGGIAGGGKGGLGRWRYDAAMTAGSAPTVDPAATPAARGPMLVQPPNPIFEIKQPKLTIAGTSGDEIKVIVTHSDGLSEEKTVSMMSGMQLFQTPTLGIGLNTVCVIVPGGRVDKDEAKNCIEVAFVP